MNKIIKAFRQSFESLLRLRMILLVILPPVLAVFGVFVVFLIFWNSWLLGVEGLLQGFWPFQWIERWTGTDGFMQALAILFLVLVFIPASFLLAVLITAIFVMPIALKWVVETDFPHLEKKKGGSVVGSVFNMIYATFVYIFLFFITLPLWLLPGCQVLVPLLLTSWLNKKIFLYDVLQDFASKEERRAIEREESGTLFGMGMLLGILAYIPFAIFFVPVIAALCYTYYGLNELSARRTWQV